MHDLEIIPNTDRRAAELVQSYYRRSELIPFIGSGFTKDCPAFKSKVPDAKALISGIKKLAQANNDLSDTHKLQINGISSLKSCFGLIARPGFIPQKITRNYFEAVFSKVKLAAPKKSILDLDWPHIFTFNIDDAIENHRRDLIKVLPHRQVSVERANAGKCLFKIHGDISDYLVYEDTKLIFTWKEYAESISTNASTLSMLRDFARNGSLLFIGCSLDAEVDLQNLAKDYTFSRSIFLKVGDIDIESEMALQDYGIKTIIKFDNYDEIYTWLDETLRDIAPEPRLQNLEIEVNPTTKGAIIDYIAKGGPIFHSNSGKRVASLPEITIARELIGRNRSNISNNAYTAIIGRRFAGKTTALLEIYKEFTEYNTYFLPSTEAYSPKLKSLIEKNEHSMFIFDSNSIASEDFKEILKLRTSPTNRLVFCFSKSDFEQYRPSLDRGNVKFHTITLAPNLSSQEATDYTGLLNTLGLPNYKFGESLLDFSYRVYGEYKSQIKSSKLFDRHLNEELFNICLLTAAFDKATSGQLTSIDPEFDVSRFTAKYEIIFESERLSGGGGKVILCNSKPWLFTILKDASRTNAKAVVDYTSNLVSLLLKNGHQEAANSLIRFDKLNEIFSSGAAKLIREIYRKLHGEYNKIPHYWLQMAKCELMAGKSSDELDHGIHCCRKIRIDDGGKKTNTYYSATLILGQLLCKKYERTQDFELFPDMLSLFIESFENYQNNKSHLDKVRANYKSNKHSIRMALDALFGQSNNFSLLNKSTIKTLQQYLA
ncbi:SIR2 family protein [Pseudomonas sp. NFACC13-1]|uniref:SIR2 family protein n=1 Tax=Pseudomonas sp. NFACC13-1 TaxID=1566245 RepID=UPI0008854FFF|nr:SIR2 family protein [Pseudomonas sp. NFACC13-1]SDB63667.1 SIR2-like domain-containing protein [Pseudomonas sp. NFACC13-1]